MRNLKQLLQEKRSAIFALAEHYGAYNIRLFGSVARGEATASSDIDFLVNVKPGFTLFEFGAFQRELAALLDCEIDVVTEEDISTYIRQQVLAEAVPL